MSQLKMLNFVMDFVNQIPVEERTPWATTTKLIAHYATNNPWEEEVKKPNSTISIVKFILMYHFTENEEKQSFDPLLHCGRIIYLLHLMKENGFDIHKDLYKFSQMGSILNTAYLTPDEIKNLKALTLTGAEEEARSLLLKSYDYGDIKGNYYTPTNPLCKYGTIGGPITYAYEMVAADETTIQKYMQTVCKKAGITQPAVVTETRNRQPVIKLVPKYELINIHTGYISGALAKIVHEDRNDVIAQLSSNIKQSVLQNIVSQPEVWEKKYYGLPKNHRELFAVYQGVFDALVVSNQ